MIHTRNKQRLPWNAWKITLKNTLQYYENNAVALCARYEAAPLADLHALLLSLLPKQERIVELGSGSGRDGAFLVAQGYDWMGIEGARAMAARSRALHPDLQGRILCADLRHPLPFPDAIFGAVFSFAALMHLESSAVCPVLRETARILKPGAPLVISVPLSRTDVDNTGVDPEGRYFLPWDQDAWCNACSTAGFTITECIIASDSLGRPITWLNLVAQKDAQTAAP